MYFKQFPVICLEIAFIQGGPRLKESSWTNGTLKIFRIKGEGKPLMLLLLLDDHRT